MIPIPGGPSGNLKRAIQWLNIHGARGHDQFDYPDYAGAPQSITARLYSDEVDYIQENWYLLSQPTGAPK